MSSNGELSELIERLNEEQARHVRAYIESLLGERSNSGAGTWKFDFVEHFRQAKVSAVKDRAGMEVQVADASSGGLTRPALWEHPPLAGAAVISYAVPIPPHLRALKLKFYAGIRDGSELPGDRYVAFRVVVNGWKLWSVVKNTMRWDEYTVDMPELASDVARIEFQTDGLGDHRWNWAVWGEPRLVAEV